jgi:trk system potassium uptake protein TrkA
MKSVLIIGVGNFGRHLATSFAKLGNEVMVVDINEERIQKILPFVTSAQIGDCTNEELLKGIGVRNFDMCYVCVGENFQSNLEITCLLKDLGGKFVVSKASKEIHEKFLLRNGADQVIYPERDMAEKLAKRHSARYIYDYIELTKDMSIYEIPIMEAWAGKTIGDLNFREKYKVSILATKNKDQVFSLPTAEYVFKSHEHILVVGKYSDVEKILGHMIQS